MSGYKFRGEDVSNLIKYRDIEIQKCISCNSKKFKEFSNSKFFPSVKCCNCGLIWMQPSFSEKGLQKYYSDYIGRRRVNNKEKMEQRQEQYKIDIEFIQRHVSEGLMLDIGFSGGFFLNGFSEKFEKHGIEIDQNAVDFANKNFDNLSGKVSCTNLEDYNTNLNFDLITMRGVIEHVTDPEREIKKVSQLLNKGGFFGIAATPNSNAVCVDIFRDKWTLFHPIQHLWHFSPETLSMICERYSLQLIASDFPYLGTPYENVYEDIKIVSESINRKEKGEELEVSPAFFGNMMSLIFKKI